MRRLVPVVIAALALLAGCGGTPPTPDEPATTRRLAGFLDDAVAARHFRGAVEVRLGDQVLLRRGFDTAGATPNGPDTRFAIGPLTEQFTALAVLILQEQGRLRVTDRLCERLPDCPPAWQAITLDQLLTHTSGLFDYLDLTPAAALREFARFGTHRPTPGQLTSVVAGRPLEFAPGTRWDHSSSGYLLLGRVVERLSGEDYERFLRTAILDPLGMSGTGYRPGQLPEAGFAVGYHDWTRPAQTLDASVYYAGGGMYSTARDLARWNRFLLTGRPAVVHADTLAELLRARVETAPTERYGYGIRSHDVLGAQAFFQRGLMAGYSSYDEVQPATGVSVVVLSNLDTVDAAGIGQTLAAMASE